ncbi:MAG: FG-GAP-like repeat-containing protein [Phycisphaerales bacterium]
MVTRLLAAVGLLVSCAPAKATWSILLVDVRTGEIAVGSATCLTGLDLRATTPVLIPLVGAATAQSQGDATGQNRVFIRDALVNGLGPAQVLSGLSVFDAGNHESRQYGMLDALGRTLTFSGMDNGQWAGGQTGRIGDLAYAIQGNVITGPCVVQAAVNAAVNTPGDLSTKLMASMEAARAAGGDGRCSCSAGGPEACGCPPTPLGKSSHIAYMLVARAGDREGCVGLYRLPTSISGVTHGDVNGDGRLDLLSAAGAGPSFVFFANTTPLDGAAPTFAPAALVPLNGTAAPRNPVVADFNRDGLPDIAASLVSGGQFIVALGMPGGGLTRGTTFPAGGTATALTLLDADGQNGPDLAFTIAATGSLALALNDGQGGFTLVGPIAIAGAGTGNTTIATGDLNSDGRADIVVGLRTSPAALAVLLGRGDGTFIRDANLVLTGSPSAVAVGDVTGDGAADIIVGSDSNRTIRAFTRTAVNPLTFSGTTLTLPVGLTPSRVRMAELTGDGLADLVVTASGNVVTLGNIRNGTFALGQTLASPSGANIENAAADFDGNGLADVAGAGGTVMLTFPNRGGALATPGGCATGTYYLNLNVANQAAGNPDPVLTLRNQFNAFRVAQRSRVDAVLSTVSGPGPCAAAGGQTIELRIDPRDIDGAAITTPLTARLRHAPSSNGLSFPGQPPVQDADGRIHIPLTLPLGGVGEDLYTVELDDGTRTVELMPPFALRLVRDTDFAGDGTTGPDDLAAFMTAFFMGAPDADFNRDGLLSPDDLDDYITAFFDAC